MEKDEYHIQLIYNSETILEGDITEIHDLGEDMVRIWQFDVEGLIELRITRNKL